MGGELVERESKERARERERGLFGNNRLKWDLFRGLLLSNLLFLQIRIVCEALQEKKLEPFRCLVLCEVGN